MTERNNGNETPEAESPKIKVSIKTKLLGLLSKFKKSKIKEKSSDEEEEKPFDERSERPLEGKAERPLNEGAERPLEGRKGRPTEEEEGKLPEKKKLKLDKIHFVVIALAIVAISVIILAGVLYVKANAMNAEEKHEIVVEPTKIPEKVTKPGSEKEYIIPIGFDWVETPDFKFAKPDTWVIDTHSGVTGNSSLVKTVWAEDAKNTHINVFAFKHDMTKTERITDLKVSQLNEICVEDGATAFKVIEFKELKLGERETLESLFYYTLGENRYLAYQITVPGDKKDYVFTISYRNISTTMDVGMIIKFVVASLHIN